MGERDWLVWHEPYADPTSSLARRLVHVQRLLADALLAAPPGPINLVSGCAGQGHDVLGVLPQHPRRADVRALLVEADPRNADRARARAGGTEAVEVRRADAGAASAYEAFVPADVVMLCGVFGNITDEDIEGTITALPTMCAAGATVLWTRHRGAPDVTPTICRWFEDAGFAEVEVVRPSDTMFCVGAHRFRGDPQTFERGRRLFAFVGYDELLGS